MTPPSARSPWAVLASTSLAVFAVFLDTTILFVAFPSIQADFSDVSPSTLSWVLNAYTIVFAALLIPAGRLADRIGRRRTFLAAAVLFTIASMLCGVAPTAGLLVGGPGPAGRRRRGAGPVVAGPRAADLPPLEDPGRGGHLGCRRCRRRCGRTDARRAGRREPRLALGLLHQPARRDRQLLPRPPGAARGSRGEPRPPPRPARCGAAGRRAGAGGLRHRQTDDWGWTSTSFVATMLERRGADRAVRVALRASSPTRCSTSACSSRRRSAGPTPAPSSSRSGSPRCSSATCCSSRRSGASRSCEAGLAISVGPLIVAATAPFFGRLAARIGQRRLLLPGGLVWASGGMLLILRASTTADYVGALPARRGAHRPGRVALPPAAVVGRGPGPAARPVRLRLGREPGHPQPRRDARRRARRRVHQRPHPRHRARRLPPRLVAAGGERHQRHGPGHAAPSPRHRRRKPPTCRSDGMTAFDRTTRLTPARRGGRPIDHRARRVVGLPARCPRGLPHGPRRPGGRGPARRARRPHRRHELPPADEPRSGRPSTWSRRGRAGASAPTR